MLFRCLALTALPRPRQEGDPDTVLAVAKFMNQQVAFFRELAEMRPGEQAEAALFLWKGNYAIVYGHRYSGQPYCPVSSFLTERVIPIVLP